MTTAEIQDPGAGPRPDELHKTDEREELRAQRPARDEPRAQRPPHDGAESRAPGRPPEPWAMEDEPRAIERRHDPSEPDIFLDVPIVKVDEISLDVENLSAQVSLAARVGNLVQLNVGAEAHVGHLNLTIKGVEAKAVLEVYLEKVYAILARTMTTLDRNPELLAKLLEPVGQAVAAVGRTAEKTVPQLGQSLGNTVERTVPQLGHSLGNTVEKTVPE
ncbi:MAG TPA: hypothetical protein VHW23_26555, partial [Kofleriaceae bacterium]|nr:hypothetical protein [Kofleriaceae bacterium]